MFNNRFVSWLLNNSFVPCGLSLCCWQLKRLVSESPWTARCFKQLINQVILLPSGCEIIKYMHYKSTLRTETPSMCLVDPGVLTGCLFIWFPGWQNVLGICCWCGILVPGFWAIYQTADPLIQVNLLDSICVTGLRRWKVTGKKQTCSLWRIVGILQCPECL